MSYSILPFKPTQAGFSAAYGDGIQRIALDGGSGRYRATVSENSHSVNAQWVLVGADYDAFVGFVRGYKRAGAKAFKVGLSIDGSELAEYMANFIPGSPRLVSRIGRVFTVAATLEVQALAQFEDAETDPYATAYELLPYYGSFAAIQDMMNRLEKLVNRDWPHA